MKQTLLIMVLALGMCSINGDAQTKKPVRKTTASAPKESREYQVGADGFEWYLVKDKGLYGAISKDGKILVPVEYKSVFYQSDPKGANGFIVDKDDKCGYYKRDGTLIIPLSSRYSTINRCVSSAGEYYCATKRGTKGDEIFYNEDGEEICEINGYLIPKPCFAEGKFYWEASDYDFKRYLLDGSGLVIIGPVDYFEVVNGNIRNMKDGVIGSLSAVSTTNNPFSKETRKGIVYSSGGNGTAQQSGQQQQSGGTTTVVVEHHRDPVPVQQWQACWACGGMGTMGCDNCGGGGTKYIGDRLHRCSRCNGQGIIPCNICYGNKGQYITVYQ